MARVAVLPDGLELPYVEQGDRAGVPLLLLHAWVDSLRVFDQVMTRLPQRVHAFAFDQRGHGGATKPESGYGLSDFAGDVGAFLNAVGVDAAVIAGASSGGYVAQRFAVDHPDRTLALALLGSPRSLRGLRPPFADVVAALKDPIDAAFVRQFNQGMIRRKAPDAIMDVLCRENLKVPARVWRDALEGLLAAEPPLDTGGISLPTLIVFGAHDAVARTRRPRRTRDRDRSGAARGLRRRWPLAGHRGAGAHRGRPHRAVRRSGRTLKKPTGGISPRCAA